jgi:subtilase family serine protease
LPATTPIQATVTLTPTDPDGLTAYANAVSTPGDALYRHYLTSAQFAVRFGSSPARIAAVRNVLIKDGLHPAVASANGLSIRIESSAGLLSRAFGTSFHRYQLSTGRLAYANVSPPRLPTSIAASVQDVIGLDDLVVAQPQLVRAASVHRDPVSAASPAPQVTTGGPQPCAAATASGYEHSTYTADRIDAAYSFSALYQNGDLGAGQTIAMYELESDSPSDITGYQACYGTAASVNYVPIDGGAGSGDGVGEAALDIEMAIGAAPQASQLVYQAPNDASGSIDEWNAIVSQDRAAVVSTSWGLCEPETTSATAAAQNTLFQEAATQGQSIVAASGDEGSTACSPTLTGIAVDDPANQPYVTAVGGTALESAGPPPSETVWNDPTGAGGGGVSAYFAMPSYQSAAAASLHVVNANSSGTPCGAGAGSYCRETPDVALDAAQSSGFVEYWDGFWIPQGGTSGSAPLFAGLLALTNASSTCAGTNVGFVNPALYSVAGKDYANDFYDITSGNNDPSGENGGLYPAGVGYDMASGLGAPDGATLPADLCAVSIAPAVTRISPAAGPTAGGTTVTVTGSGFSGATKVVFGAVAAAGFTVVNASTITAVSPAQPAGRPNVFVTTPGGTSVAVVADRFTYHQRHHGLTMTNSMVAWQAS